VGLSAKYSNEGGVNCIKAVNYKKLTWYTAKCS